MKDVARFNKGKAMDLIMSEACRLSAAAKFVAVHLINRSRADEKMPSWNKAWPASSTIARATSLKQRAVDQAISDLRRLGAELPVEVMVQRRYRTDGSGGRDSNMYRFCLPATRADKSADLTRNQRGQARGDLPAETGGVIRKNGGGIPAAGAEESSKEPSQEPSKGRELVLTPPVKSSSRTRKPPKIALPADFVPDASVYDRAVKLGFARERVAGELEKLRDWAASNGRQCVDWQAALRNWLSKAKEFEGEGHGRRNGAPLKQSRDGRNWQAPEGTPQ